MLEPDFTGWWPERAGWHHMLAEIATMAGLPIELRIEGQGSYTPALKSCGVLRRPEVSGHGEFESVRLELEDHIATKLELAREDFVEALLVPGSVSAVLDTTFVTVTRVSPLWWKEISTRRAKPSAERRPKELPPGPPLGE